MKIFQVSSAFLLLTLLASSNLKAVKSASPQNGKDGTLTKKVASMSLDQKIGETLPHAEEKEYVKEWMMFLNNFGISTLTNDETIKFTQAIQEKDWKMVELLLQQNGIYINQRYNDDDYTFLIAASKEGNVEMVERLLKMNAKVNSVSRYNLAALHVAARHGHADVVKVLLEHGAEIDAKDRIGRTVLHHAVLSNSLEIVKELLQPGADIDAKDNFGKTAFFYAVYHNSPEIVKELLQHEANVNGRDRDGNTPLAMAARRGYLTVVKILLDTPDIDANLKNDEDKTALDLAVEERNFEVIDQLRKFKDGLIHK